MFIINREDNRIEEEVRPRKFSELGLQERYHLQEWLENFPEAFGEELLYIQKEFDGFDETRERLDLLALDKQGNLVIIENKLDDSGRDVTWQVLKYASYCSSLSKPQIKEIYQSYLNRKGVNESSEENIAEFLNSDFADVHLNQDQRIILVAGSFRKEVTSTVLWLLTKYKLKIQCFKAVSYSFDGKIFLNIELIIPVKEAKDYTIKMAEKAQEEQNTQDELKNLQTLRIEFWKQFLQRFAMRSHLFSSISPSKVSWISASTGLGGVAWTFVFNNKLARTEVYISRSTKEENKLIFDELRQQQGEIESVTGNLIWEPLENKKACRIKQELDNVSLLEREDWDRVTDFLIESMLKLEAAFKKPLQKIRLQLKEQFHDL